MLKSYLKKIFEISERGDAREESYYSNLEGLINEYAESVGKKDIQVTTLPKKTEAGNPDFRIWDGKQSIVGYIEAKKPTDEDLDHIERSEQLQRYLHGDAALDTNTAIAALNGEVAVVNKLQDVIQVFLPLPVVGELLFGALNSRHAETNLSRIQQLIQRCKVLEMRLETASLYARARISLKQKGRPISENDIWIAASCLEHSITLMTNDSHFRWIEGFGVTYKISGFYFRKLLKASNW